MTCSSGTGANLHRDSGYLVRGRTCRFSLLPQLTCCFLAAMALLASSAASGRAETLKLEAQLIWGTNDAKSPDKDHKPVDADIEKKLKDLPLKWSHYFVVNRKRFEVPSPGTQKVSLSDKCEIEAKSVAQSMLEVSHFGHGKKTWQGNQALPRCETHIV